VAGRAPPRPAGTADAVGAVVPSLIAAIEEGRGPSSMSGVPADVVYRPAAGPATEPGLWLAMRTISPDSRMETKAEPSGRSVRPQGA